MSQKADVAAPISQGAMNLLDSSLPDSLRNDAVLVQYLRERGLDGPVWQRLLTQLLGFGVEFVTGLVRSGAIFARCRRRGLRLHQQPVPPDDIEDLASEVVMAGFVLFKDEGLLGGRWSADRGLTLKQYFINACVLSFPNVYRRWQTGRNAWSKVQLLDAFAQLEQAPTRLTPEDEVMARAAVDELFKQLSADGQTIMTLVSQDYSHAEIAEILRLTPRAVEARVRRIRLAARSLSDGAR